MEILYGRKCVYKEGVTQKIKEYENETEKQ